MGVFFALSEVFQGKRKDICWGSRLVHVHHVKLKIVKNSQSLARNQYIAVYSADHFLCDFFMS